MPSSAATYARRRHLINVVVVAWYGETWPPSCSCCGTSEGLTIDHIDGDGAQHRLELFQDARASDLRFYRWLIAGGFPAGYQVLCLSCNASKHVGERCRIDHAAEQAGKRKCRCCRAYKPLGGFVVDRSHRDGRKTICKSCYAKQAVKRRAAKIRA